MKKSIIILLIAIGIGLILIGYNQKKERISNFHKNSTSITVIDLSKKTPDYFNYYLISGILFISLGLAVSVNVLTELRVNQKSNSFDLLTIQERKIVLLINEGKRNKEIANELSISLNTIKSHTNNIYKKLGVNSRTKLMNCLKESKGLVPKSTTQNS